MRKPEPDDFYGGPPPSEYVKRGEVWREAKDGGPWQGPTEAEWIARIMSRQTNDGGAPTPSVRQSERKPPRWDGPMIRPRDGT